MSYEALRAALAADPDTLVGGLKFNYACTPDTIRSLLARVDELESLAVAPRFVAWQPMDTVPESGGPNVTLLGLVNGATRLIRWGKVSHVPMYGWCLADQGPEDFDLCEPAGWMPLPLAGAATAQSDSAQSDIPDSTGKGSAG